MEYIAKQYTDNDITVHYMEAGKGEPLLFLPGGIRSGVYEKNRDSLARHFRVIMPDLPGFGESTVPHSVWGLEEYGEFFYHFVNDLGLARSIVIGHSLGGGTALVLAKKCKTLKQLILFGTAGIKPVFSKGQFAYNMFVKKTIYDVKHAKSSLLKAIILNNGLSTIFENITHVSHLRKVAEKCIFSDITGLEEVTIPVTLLWGDKDELFTLSSAHALQEKLSDVTLEVIDGNHDWCIIDPQKCTSLILQYIK